MTVNDDERLFQLRPPWLFRIVANESEATDYSWSIASRSPRTVVRILRGAKMGTVFGLFDEIAAALQFPYYFGENWDALDECINDLSWLPGDNYVLVVTDSAVLLNRENDCELATFLRILTDSCEAWSRPIDKGESWDRPGRPFHVILCATVEGVQHFEQRLQKVGMALGDL